MNACSLERLTSTYRKYRHVPDYGDINMNIDGVWYYRCQAKAFGTFKMYIIYLDKAALADAMRVLHIKDMASIPTMWTLINFLQWRSGNIISKAIRKILEKEVVKIASPA